MKKIKENAINLILIGLLIFLASMCYKQLYFAVQFSKTIEHFRFVFPFVNTEITNDTFFTIAIRKKYYRKWI